MLSAVALAAVALVSRSAATAELEELSDGPGFAVVELFTSQGCSSCPPADRVLARLAAVAEKENLPIYPLSMHVDYWNRLGWRDPFSSPKYSARQQAYVGELGGGAFTPQVIVNGADETVGSRVAEVADLVRRHTSRAPEAQVTLSVTRDGREVTVAPVVTGGPENGVVWLALSRRTAANHVPAGENSGRDLRHAHVVVALERVGEGETVSFELPADVRPSDLAVTGLVQAGPAGRIVGAARKFLSPA